MDARDEIRLREAILVDVRRLLNAKFNTGSEELSSDSKLAIQQLSGSVSAIRDELSKSHSSFRLISVTVDDINSRISVLGAELKDARVLKDIGDLKIAIDKLWDHIAVTDSTKRLGVLEKAVSDIVNRMAAIEKVAATPVKRNAAEVHTANVDHAAIHDVTARVGDVLTQLQGVKLQIEDINLKVLNQGQVAVTNKEDEVGGLLRDRLVAVELSLSSMTNATIDSLVTERELHKVEVDILKQRLDLSEKALTDLDTRFRAFTTLSLNHTSLNANGVRLDAVPDATAVEPRLEALEAKVNGAAPAHPIVDPHHQPVVQPHVNFDFPTTIPVQVPVQIVVAQPLLFGAKLN